jgi:ClpP class serine protease
MDVVFSDQRVETLTKKDNRTDEYREAVRKLISDEVKAALDEEVKKAAQELAEERRKAVKAILEEHKLIISQVVEEEKKNIWKKAEALRQSILRVGL